MSELEEILDQCIDRVLAGESVEGCLASYPAEAKELEPLLRLSLATARAASVEPSAEFKAMARQRLHRALSQRQANNTPRRRFSLWSWQPRWAGVLALILLGIFLSTGAVVASQDSMPNDILYPVKRGWERVKLALIRDEMGRAERRLDFAQRRLDEVEALEERGKEVPGWLLSEIGDETDEVARYIEASLDEGGGDGAQGRDSERWEQRRAELVDRLLALTERQQEVLQRVAAAAPESAQGALQRALERSRRGHQQASQALQRIHPSGSPEHTPGQPQHTPRPQHTPGVPQRKSGQPEHTPGPPQYAPGQPEHTPGVPQGASGPPERTVGPPQHTPGAPESPGRP